MSIMAAKKEWWSMLNWLLKTIISVAISNVVFQNWKVVGQVKKNKVPFSLYLEK